MKNQPRKILGLGILIAGIILLLSTSPEHYVNNIADSKLTKTDSTEELKANALKVLQTKCNVCHKKQNPFMIFKAKNMDKRASKINKMVFITGKMPKGDDNTLTQNEFDTLKDWLKTLNIN